MRPVAIRATMERRVLVNYRVEPAAMARVLPPPFRPALVDGLAIGGVCLIRLAACRPAGFPAPFGLASENAAHRMAVSWDGDDGPHTGVYIPRRDTSSRLAVLLGGRLLPGWQHRARFHIDAGPRSIRVEMASEDGEVEVTVAAQRAETVMPGSVFATVEEASRFFAYAPLSYAATPTEGRFDGVCLDTDRWKIAPLHLDHLRSSYFDDPARFPAGTAVADSAFLMSGLDTTWRSAPALPAPVFRLAGA